MPEQTARSRGADPRAGAVAPPGAGAGTGTRTVWLLSGLVGCLGAQYTAAATLLPEVFDQLGQTQRFGANYAFFLAFNLVGVTLGGTLGQRLAPAPVLSFAALGLGGGSVAVAMSTSVEAVLLGRSLQGLGGGVAIVAVYVAIGSAFGPRRRPSALAAVTTGWVVATVVGPVVAASCAELAGWRATYAGLGAITVLVTLALSLGIRAVRPASSRAPLRPLALVLVPAAAVLAIGLDLGSGVSSLAVLAVLAVVVAVGLRPLLPPGTLVLRHGVGAAIGLRGLAMGAFAATELWLPYFLQHARDLSAVTTGVWLGCGAVGWALGSQTYARCSRGVASDTTRIRFTRWGSGLLCLGVAGQALPVFAAVPVPPVLALWVVASFGLGLALVPMATSLYAESRVESYPRNAAAFQLADVSVSACVIGLGGTLAEVVPDAHRVEVVVASFLLAALLAGFAAVHAPRICSSTGPGQRTAD